MTLQETIKANPDGFTFDPRKGKMINKKKGYFVAITDNPTDGSQRECDKFMKAFTYTEKIAKRNLYIGGWKHGEIYYLDYSMHTLDYDEAMSIARAFNQVAIFGIENQVSLEVSY